MEKPSNLDLASSKILNAIKGWNHTQVTEFLEKNDLKDYVPFAENKNLNGSTLLVLSEGIVAVWKPKVDPKKLISVINDLKERPQNYYDIQNNKILNSFDNQNSNVNHDENHIETVNIVIKRHSIKPQVPVRVSSLKRDIDIVLNNGPSGKDAVFDNNAEIVDDKNEKVNRISVNLEKIEAPKSFLYSQKLINAVSKLYPYLPMKMSSSNDVVLRKKFRFGSDGKITDSAIFQDAGYYEMSSRKSIGNMRRHSDGSINADSNPYEELFFKSKASTKRRFGIWRRLFRKNTNTFRWTRTNSKEDYSKVEKTMTADIVNNKSSRLQRFNDLVMRTLNPKITINYKLKDNKTDKMQTEGTIKTVKFKRFSDSSGQRAGNVQTKIENTAVEGNIESINGASYQEPSYSKCANNLDETNDIDLEPIEHFYEEAEPFAEVIKMVEIEDTIDVRDVIDPNSKIPIEVEDYLEPIKCFNPHEGETVMDNLADEIIKLFDSTLESADIFKESYSMVNKEMDESKTNYDNPKPARRINADTINNNSFNDTPIPVARQPKPKIPMRTKNKANSTICEQLNNIKESIDEENTDKMGDVLTSNDRPFETLHRWNESLKNGAKRKKEAIRRSMIDRPLPVPVENEFYYMEVGRQEAEELLEGHADGTFILRPSSQSSHVYTVTVIYQGRVYNIGCRRRQDGRLALGFSKPGEQSFLTIDQMIEHYYTERLLLIQDGVKVGSTTLRKLDGG